MADNLSTSGARPDSVTFSKIYEDLPHIRLATTGDNEAILALLRETAMAAGSMRVRYERAPDFFRFVACQGNPYTVFVTQRDDGHLVGVSVESTRPGWVNGRQVPVGYLSDLRVSPLAARPLRVEWRRAYEIFLETAHRNSDTGYCEYFFTAVLKENVAAVQALARGKSAMDYVPLREYRAVQILASRLFAAPACLMRMRLPAGFHLEWLDVSQDDQLGDLLSRANVNRNFGYCFPEELAFRRRQWPGFASSRFLVARNNAGRIVASVAPWGASEVRRLVADKLPGGLQAVMRVLRAAGIKAVVEGEEIKVCYLTHLEFEPDMAIEQKGRIFRSMICELFARGVLSPFHLASFADDPLAPLRPYLSGFFTQETAGIIYQVLHKADGASRRLNPAQPVAVEIGTL